jgi:hypothetical protein
MEYLELSYATNISLPSNHASFGSHPNEIAQLILAAANNSTTSELKFVVTDWKIESGSIMKTDLEP